MAYVAISVVACVSVAPVEQSPSAPAIEVWLVGRPGRSVPTFGHLPETVQRQASAVGLRLNVRTVDADAFHDAFAAARAGHGEPDILFVPNRGLLDGFPASSPYSYIKGIAEDKGVSDALVNVTESLRSLESIGGWNLLVQTSPHYAEARAFALRPIDCTFEKGSAWPAWTDPSGGALTNTAERAVVAHVTNDQHELNQLSGGHYPLDALPIERPRHVLDKEISPPVRTVHEFRVCGAWGNGRLAFLAVVVAYESPNEIGYRELLAIVSAPGSEPTLLALSETPDIVPSLRQNVIADYSGKASASLPPLDVASPGDEVSVKRFTPMPKLKWNRPESAGHFFYVIEWQFGSFGSRPPREWTSDQLLLVPPRAIDHGARTVTVDAPFRDSYAARRWRVWAFDTAGDYTRSEWRIVYSYAG